jgi:hypothetical protein
MIGICQKPGKAVRHEAHSNLAPSVRLQCTSPVGKDRRRSKRVRTRKADQAP